MCFRQKFHYLTVMMGLILSTAVQAANNEGGQNPLLAEESSIKKPGLFLYNSYPYQYFEALPAIKAYKLSDVDFIFAYEESHSSLETQSSVLDNSPEAWSQAVADLAIHYPGDPIKIKQLEQLVSLNIEYKWQSDQNTFFFLSGLIKQPNTLSAPVIQVLATARFKTIEARSQFEKKRRLLEQAVNLYQKKLSLSGYNH